MKIAIRNGRVIDPASNFDAQADVFITASKIIAIGELLISQRFLKQIGQ